MSDYVREKVLRIPVTAEQEKEILSKYNVGDLWDLEFEIDNFGYGDVGKFQKSPTVGSYIDYVLEYEYGSCCGDFGKSRELSEKEKEKYKHLFSNFYDGFDINKVRLVEFCWYNCCESPDYYNITKDNFYDEI